MQVYDRDLPLCVWCQAPLSSAKPGKRPSLDHVVTRRDGGLFKAENLVLACRLCNFKRGDMSVLQYMTYRAGLPKREAKV